MTMRQLLDTLKEATDDERREFSEWWAGLPVPIGSFVWHGPGIVRKDLRNQLYDIHSNIDMLMNGDSW